MKAKTVKPVDSGKARETYIDPLTLNRDTGNNSTIATAWAQ